LDYSKTKKKTKMKRMKKMKKKKNLLFRSKIAFCCKKFEKCRINIKKMSPTPKSIIHKNPIKISPSSSKRSIPNVIK
jgi:hypothetical protein